MPLTAAEFLIPQTFPCGHRKEGNTYNHVSKRNGHVYHYQRCLQCSRERHRLLVGEKTMTREQACNFARLRDGVAIHPCALRSLVNYGFAFYDRIMKCYRPEPLTLEAFNDREKVA